MMIVKDMKLDDIEINQFWPFWICFWSCLLEVFWDIHFWDAKGPTWSVPHSSIIWSLYYSKFTVVLQKILEVWKVLNLLVEYRSPLIFVDLYFLLCYDLLLSFLLWLLRFFIVVFALLCASQTLIKTIFILQVIDCFSSVLLLAFDMILA